MSDADESTVVYLKTVNDRLRRKTSLDGGGGPPHDSDMDSRLTALEAAIPTLATKAGVQEGFVSMIKWIVGTAGVGIGLSLTIMAFVLNNAVPKQAPPPLPQPPPVIIQVPMPPAPAPSIAP